MTIFDSVNESKKVVLYLALKQSISLFRSSYIENLESNKLFTTILIQNHSCGI